MPTMTKTRWLALFALLFAFLFERVYQKFRQRLRPPPLFSPKFSPSTSYDVQSMLDSTSKAHFRDHGYVIIRNALDPHTVDFLRNVSTSFGTSVPGPYSSFMNNPWRMQEGLLDFLSYGPTGSLAAKLMGVDSVRLVLDYMITMSDDGAKGSPFHADMMHIR